MRTANGTRHHDCRPCTDRKALGSDITLKRKAVTTAKASLKAIREKKQKVDMPVFSDI
jgi:hypothetical protein